MYTPLNIKTENTLLTSLIKIDELVSFALSNNIRSLSITDTKMYGVYYFYKKCIENDIKPIIGLDINYDEYNIILYCKNYNGYKALLKLSSIDKVSSSDFINPEDLICIVPYTNLDKYEELKKIFSNIYVGYKNKKEEELGYANMVYMNDILCINKSDLGYLKYLECIKTGKNIKEIPNRENYLVSFEEINKLYPRYIENNYKISDMCDLKIEYSNDLLPKYECPNDINSFNYLKSLCIDKMKKIFGSSAPKIYIDRLKYELDIINKMGFCNYFLIVQDYVGFAKNNGILVGPGRGSAAGSLVSYLLNITTIDPIKYNLLFERFLNPERVTMPDIDVDFEYTRREEVVDYCISKYGNKKVAPIITFGTLGAKQSIRDVGRCLNIPNKTIDRICSFIDSDINLKDNYNNPNIKKILSTDKNLIKLYNIASRIEGLKRHTSIHAAGIVMSNVDLDEVIPLEKNNDSYITGYSMEFLEELGLLKMDFLALKNLTLINDILKETNTEFNEIPMNDKETIDLFKFGNTNGIFQFESSGMISFLKKFKPSSFEDIIASIALYRPGPMSNIDSYIKRKHGIEKIEYIVPSLEPILKSTYGIIVYQEQIMQIAQTMAGFSYGEADILRRAMSKKKESVLIKEREKFINGCISNGYSLNDSNKVYDLILKFASYGFNRAHSVAYAMISYRIAYLKVHYPLIFMKNLLNSNIGSDLKIKEYIYECKCVGINVLTPDINISDSKFILEDNNLVFPLTSIKGVGNQYALKIISEREKGEFLNIFDFTKRCNINGIMEELIFSGCLNSFGYNKKTLIDNLEKINNYSSLGDLFDDDKFLPILDLKEEYDSKYLMEKEYDLFGFYLSNHPITSYKKKYNTIDLSNIPNYFDKIIDLVIYVDRIKEIDTKKGDKMCFITGSDEGSNIDVILFPKVYDNSIKIHDILYLNGRVEKRHDKYQFVVNKIKEIIN